MIRFTSFCCWSSGIDLNKIVIDLPKYTSSKLEVGQLNQTVKDF